MPVSLEASLRLVVLALSPCFANFGDLEQTLALAGFTDQFTTARAALHLGTDPLSSVVGSPTPDGLMRELAYLLFVITHCVYRSLALLRSQRERTAELPATEQDSAVKAFLGELQREFRLAGVFRAAPELFNPTPPGEEEALRAERLRRLFEAENLEVTTTAVQPLFGGGVLMWSTPLAAIAWAGSYVVFETMGPAITLCAYSLCQALHMVSLPHTRAAQSAVRASAREADERSDGKPHSFVCTRLAETYVDAQECHKRNDGGELNLRRLRNRAALLALATADFLLALSSLVPGQNPAYELKSTPGEILVHLDSLVRLGVENARPYVMQSLGAMPGTVPHAHAPGTAPTGSPHGKADASSGHRFILEQLKLKDSAYQMPALSASQQKWEQWFEKLTQLLDHFHLAEATIIHYVTGHLEATHQLMVGWHTVVTESKRTDTAVTLQLFFEHVRKRLFVSANTRKEALLSFLALCKTPTTCVDGKALCVELQTLFARLFPDPSTGTAELEPITRYNACLKVQEMLVSLHQTPLHQRKGALVKAWTAYDFNATVVYRDFLVRSKHSESSAASAALCKSYLQRIREQLTEAHEMYVTVHRGVEGDAQQVLALAAEQLGLPSVQHLAQAVSGSRLQSGQRTGPKRGRAEPAGPASGTAPSSAPAAVQVASTPQGHGPKRHKQTGRPHAAAAAPTSRPAPTSGSVPAPPRNPASHRKRPGISDATYLREINTPEQYSLAVFCSLNGVSRTHEQCVNLAHRGLCVLCGKPRHEGITRCSKCVNPAETRTHQDRRRMWCNKVNRLGLEKALQTENAPLRVTRAPPPSQ